MKALSGGPASGQSAASGLPALAPRSLQPFHKVSKNGTSSSRDIPKKEREWS